MEEQGTKTLINPDKKRKHKKHKRKSQITDEDQESNPQLDVIYKKAGKHRSLIFLDLEESAIVINQSHESAFDVPNYSDDKMIMLYKWAIFEAIPEYRNISIAEFGSLMWGEFNCDVLEKI